MKYLPTILDYAEKIFLILLLVGAVIQITGSDGTLFVSLALSGLAAVFFLRFRFPLDVGPVEESEKYGFKEFLVTITLPKVLGISMSVATVGIMFLLLNMPGYAIMLTVGTITIGIALIMVLILKFMNASFIEALQPTLLRAAVVFVVAVVLIANGGIS